MSQTPFSPAVTQVAQTAAANLAVTATVASGTISTVSTVTNGNLGFPGAIADVASAAIITTTTTAAFTPTFGVGYLISIPVTVVTGTLPTYDVVVQESMDSGTNWSNVYTFPTIVTTGFYTSPALLLKGNRVRYVQTLGGTSPSFTRAINRLQMSAQTAGQVNSNGVFSTNTVTNTGTTLSAPANAVGFIIEAYDTNTANILWGAGLGTVSTTNGMLLQPGRDTGVVPINQKVSIFAASGTQTFTIQWIQQ